MKLPVETSSSRRSFIKAGTILALAQSLPLAALTQNRFTSAPSDLPPAPFDKTQPSAPAWMKDLIIYEVATKGFTSPNGPESGTFNSLRSKLNYLEELGINGLWLSGYSLCDPHHFYNIWTQYAVIEPNKFDPTLGTARDFKALIDEAHQHGIRVFLDVITHGLMKHSPVIKEHPEWFRGGSWGMTDFDWNGGHIELENWWVRIYTDFVTHYGIDGFRLDVDIYRPDLWERIRKNATIAGHPIVIWEELNSVIPGVTDFTQRENTISSTASGILNQVLIQNVPGFYDRKFGRLGYYEVEVRYSDLQTDRGDTKGEGTVGVHLAGLSADHVSRRINEVPAKPDGLPDIRIILSNILPKQIANITVRNEMGEEWQLESSNSKRRPIFIDIAESLGPLITPSTVDIYIASLAWGSSIQLSCHDNGWFGFPLDKSPYVAQGSRSAFGYSFLFTPMIPIFFSGEEFNATFHALPRLTPDIYGGKEPGKGRWLYGSMLDWSELEKPAHKTMLQDVMKMIAIRKQYPEVFSMTAGGEIPRLKGIQYEANIMVPVPYLRWGGDNAFVIAGNRDIQREAILQLRIDLTDTGISGHDNYLVTDLWNQQAPITISQIQLQHFSCIVNRDQEPAGGLAVFRIQPA